MTDNKNSIPNPGSNEALKLNCSCPVLDNNHGHGAFIDKDGVPQFWINGNCPLHGLGIYEEEINV